MERRLVAKRNRRGLRGEIDRSLRVIIARGRNLDVVRALNRPACDLPGKEEYHVNIASEERVSYE